MPAKVIGDIGYVFRKEFGSQGWFTGTVVKIMKDGDRRCKYSDGDVEELLLDDLVQLAKLDTNSSNSTKEKKIHIVKKSLPDVKRQSIATTKTKRKKTKRKKCIVEGCNNHSQKGGVCVTHGPTAKRCSVEGCARGAIKGGVCITHGATKKKRKQYRKLCSVEGCARGAVKEGVCITHGAIVERKRCSSKGCTNKVVRGGVCITHGAMTKRCIFKGCARKAVIGGVCITHGAIVERKRCNFEKCTSNAQKGGVCRRHFEIKANNINPTLQPNTVTPAIPSRQSFNYEDEDEEQLNSWIWRSSRRTSCVTNATGSLPAVVSSSI